MINPARIAEEKFLKEATELTEGGEQEHEHEQEMRANRK
jgi:hypothetical protein